MRDRDSFPRKPKDGPGRSKGRLGASLPEDDLMGGGLAQWLFLLVPMFLTLPLLGCCVLSYLERYSAQIGIALGFIVTFGSACVVFWIAHHYQVPPDSNPGGHVVAGVMGGLIGAMLYYQFTIVGKRKEAALWFLLELGGVGTIVVCTIGLKQANPPYLFGLVAQPNEVRRPGPGPNGPPQRIDDPAAQVVTGDRALDQALVDLQSKDHLRRRGAIALLANTPPNQHREAVAKKLAEIAPNNTFERSDLVRLLGAWGTANEVPVLLQFLQDADPGARKEALKVISKFHDERATPALARCLKDPFMRNEAEQALREIGPAAETEVLALLGQQDPFLRQAVIRVLRDIGTQQSVPALQSVAAGNQIQLRRLAQDALNAIALRAKK
jgi:HEAT repeats